MSRAAEVTRLLEMSASYRDPNPKRSHITGLDHALRVAWLGQRQNEELGFVGLVHDLARPLSDPHHGEVIAEVVRDRVTEHAYHVLRTHGEYQSAVVHDRPWPHPDEPWHKDALKLAAYELRSFNIDCPQLALDAAKQLIRRRLG